MTEPEPDHSHGSSTADTFDRYIGRYSHQLARQLVDAAGIGPGRRALDVGCGPGALTAALVEVLGPEGVCAVDPSEEYVEACRRRAPGVDVRVGVAEALPFGDGDFDAVLAQLVVNLLPDAEAGVRDMFRVARPGGVVSATVWADDGMPLLLRFWEAAMAVAPEAVTRIGETGRVGYGDEELAELWRQAGAHDVVVVSHQATADYEDFADLWEPIEAGVGRSGALCQSLDPDQRRQLRAGLYARLGSPAGPFRLTARAWCVRGTSP